MADHTYRLCLMLYLTIRHQGLSVDPYKCIQLALLHDLAECLIGDITPHDGISPQEKRRLEVDAFDRLLKVLDDPELRALWQDFHCGESKEAMLVREFDYLETLFQALEYEQDHRLVRDELQEFWNVAEERVNSAVGQEVLQCLRSQRAATGIDGRSRTFLESTGGNQ